MTAVVAVSQRVTVVPDYGERRDCLDQRWSDFLPACGLLPLPVPNQPAAALALVAAARPAGLLLSGGNDLAELGGDAPERDATERALLIWAAEQAVPVMGVCRGFQMLAWCGGGTLAEVAGHVARRHAVTLADGGGRTVNSYHRWGVATLPPGWSATARAADGSIEAARDAAGRLQGVMWHPEREAAFDAADIDLFRNHFGGSR
jgi:putative glutamine amidotransferase